MRKVIKHLAIAVVAFFCVYSGKSLVAEIRLGLLNPDDFMIVNAVEVPDFPLGDDPLIVYDRQVQKYFEALWTAKIYQITPKGKELICYGDGDGSYDPEDITKEVKLFAWYVGNIECDIKPGTHILKTTWRTRQGIVIRNTSNAFEVTEKLSYPSSKGR